MSEPRSPSRHSESDARLVSLTQGQMRHILELVSHGQQLPWGRNRRVVIEAKMRAALQAQPTPVFPEEPEWGPDHPSYDEMGQ